MSLDIVISRRRTGHPHAFGAAKCCIRSPANPCLATSSPLRALQQRSIQVIGHGAEQVRQRLAGDDLNFVVQAEQLGTGHAVA